MSDPAKHGLIEKVHASGKQLLISITGGGSRAIASLLEVPGASTSVIGAVVPYAPVALESWLGGRVDQFCSDHTARAMAMKAFELASQFSNADPYVLRGIGATASLATTRPKRGPHRIHVAWQSADTTASLSCELVKGRPRAEEETIASYLILSAMFESCGIDDSSYQDPVMADTVERRKQLAPKSWSDLLLGKRATLPIPKTPESGGKIAMSKGGATKPAVLFPGAFNPLHAGHERMAEIASQRIGAPTVFELSIINVDKPPLDFIEIATRLAGLTGQHVLLTRAPTFAEKAELAPGCVFVVGVDTVSRIADPDYYGGDAEHRNAAIATIAAQGCRFLVFGRIVDGRFLSLGELDLPSALRQLCEEVPEATFRADVSSTDLRHR